ncbi:MAG TPA: 50S ribosomal protein L1, partial [Deltaproteobacteria bacterium]|nr:50S ribosomal protein L1 [Deltaproteobacteria bacterium]
MARRGKKYRMAKEKIDSTRRYSFQEAIKLAKEC